MNPEVDVFLEKAKQWQEEMSLLRSIALECGLDESIKWMHPCYSLNNKNIVLIHGFKDYCAVLFFKGVLLQDEANLLVQQTKNVQAGRQLRFSSANEIKKQKMLIKAYILDAIEVEKSGKEPKLKSTKDFEVVPEFQKFLDEDPKLAKNFKDLTPGRQRGYLLHFAAAKQSKTRTARVEKCIPKIRAGRGLKDR